MEKEYIIVTKETFDEEFLYYVITRNQMTLVETFEGLPRHFVVSFDDERKDRVKLDEDIVHVCESDADVQIDKVQEIDGRDDNWGLARISNREWDSSTTRRSIDETYQYGATGRGVDVYVVDTGVRMTHDEFEGRVVPIFDHYRDKDDYKYGFDRDGHGTHVASTIAGKKYGVAKEAKIFVSRVFDRGSASLMAIIRGINACMVHHNYKISSGVQRPSVMNMSLGGPALKIEEQAVNDAIDAGIVCVVAAGNDNKDLGKPGYDVLPAEVDRAITVGSTDIHDKMSSFSNFGEQVDVFAPGDEIVGASYRSDSGSVVLSGTSMASPHVAGICALVLTNLQSRMSRDIVDQLHEIIVDDATKNTIRFSDRVAEAGTPNKLVYIA